MRRAYRLCLMTMLLASTAGRAEAPASQGGSGGSPASGAPASGAPASDAPASGAPASGAPAATPPRPAKAAAGKAKKSGKASSMQKIRFGRFGDVTVYSPPTPPTHAAIFLSGDGGWNAGVVDMAKMLVAKEFIVMGVDVPKLLASYAKTKERCAYPPGDLQMLAQYVEKKLGVTRYLVPILVGYSSGATLAYAALAEAPAGTFEGAVSLGFCSDLSLRKPLCKGDGLDEKPLPKGHGFDLLPAKSLPAPWTLLHGKADQVCDLKATRRFVSQTGNAKLVELDRVGHGFGVVKRWQTAYEQAVRDIIASAFAARSKAAAKPVAATVEASTGATPDVEIDDVDLPLVEVRSPVETPETPYLAVLVSGDGGWAGLDREVSAALADAGVPVVGLDSLQYFWNERTPDSAAADVQKLIAHYQSDWKKAKVILLGYSFGADVVPFVATRLPPAIKAKVAEVALISPSAKASFEFKVSDWFGGEGEDVATYPTLPEIAKLKGMQLLCFYGSDDKAAICPQLKGRAAVFALAGSHRLGDAAGDIAAAVLKGVGLTPADE